MYDPSATGPSVAGLVADVHEPPLTRAWKVELASGELNARSASCPRRGGRLRVDRRVRRDRVDPDRLGEHAGVVADPVEGAVLDGRGALGGDRERAGIDRAGEDRRVGAVGRVADWSSPAPASGALRAIETGELVYQPPEQAAALQVMLVTGAVESSVSVTVVSVVFVGRPGVARGDVVREVARRAGGEGEGAGDVRPAGRGRDRLGAVRPTRPHDGRIGGRGRAGATVGDGAREVNDPPAAPL